MSSIDELVGPFPPGVEPTQYDALRRRVLWSLPVGLYVLGARSGSARNFMTTSLVTQLATRPKLVGLAVEELSLTLSLINESGAFALTLLGRDQRAVVRSFVKPAAHDEERHTLGGQPYEDTPVTGAPVLVTRRGYLDCRVSFVRELGSHSLVVGEVVDADVSPEAGASGPFEVLRMEDTRMSYGG